MLPVEIRAANGACRHWYEHKQDLCSPLRVMPDDNLYRCLVAGAQNVLLYDLTSTYFESEFAGKRQFGYSRDKRGDCVQVSLL